jgi:hypothetical protein
MAHRSRALCPVPDSHECAIAAFEFQKLVDSETFHLRNVFWLGSPIQPGFVSRFALARASKELYGEGSGNYSRAWLV